LCLKQCNISNIGKPFKSKFELRLNIAQTGVFYCKQNPEQNWNKFLLDFEEEKSDRHHSKWPRHCAFGMVIVFDSTSATFAAVAQHQYDISHSKKIIDISPHLNTYLSDRLGPTMIGILRYKMAVQIIGLHHNDNNRH
jgi:hypothetical protein